MPGLQIVSSLPTTDEPLSSPSSGLHIVPAQSFESSAQNALVPAVNGPGAGVSGKMTAPYIESPFKPGIPFLTKNNKVHVPLTPQQADTSENELMTIKQMKPYMQQIAKMAPHFLSGGENSNVRLENVLGFLHKNLPNVFGDTNLSGEIENALHLNPNDLSNYKLYRADLNVLAQQYMKAHGIPTTEVPSAAALASVSPGAGEGPSYVNRLSSMFNNMNKGIGNVNRQALRSAVPTAPVQSNVSFAKKSGGKQTPVNNSSTSQPSEASPTAKYTQDNWKTYQGPLSRAPNVVVGNAPHVPYKATNVGIMNGFLYYKLGNVVHKEPLQ
jgi:hypothetical protein